MAFILNVTYTMKPGLRAEFLREVSRARHPEGGAGRGGLPPVPVF